MAEVNVLISCPRCKQSIIVDLLACSNGTKIYCDNCRGLIKLIFEGATLKEVVEEVKGEVAESFKKAGFKVDVH